MILNKRKVKKMLLRDIDHSVVNHLRNHPSIGPFHLQNIRQIRYNTYDLNKTLGLTGVSYANLRWHLNNFEKADHKIKVVPLQEAKKPVIHLIGQWRKDAISKRGFSFVDVRSDKQGIILYDQKILQMIQHVSSPHVFPLRTMISRVLEIDGVVKTFNLGFSLGLFHPQPVFAHAIGIADTSIPHLAEYAQIDFWTQVQLAGYQYINDGPSWRNTLETYKEKFRPLIKKDYYWATFSRPS
jgi:hypothetical protein